MVEQIGRLYEPVGYVVGLEEDGALPEHAGNGIDVEVTAMRLLAPGRRDRRVSIVVAQAIAPSGGRRPLTIAASRPRSERRLGSGSSPA